VEECLGRLQLPPVFLFSHDLDATTLGKPGASELLLLPTFLAVCDQFHKAVSDAGVWTDFNPMDLDGVRTFLVGVLE
jgi:hypothetical protein